MVNIEMLCNYIPCPTDTRDLEKPTSLGGSIIAGIAVPAVITVALILSAVIAAIIFAYRRRARMYHHSGVTVALG